MVVMTTVLESNPALFFFYRLIKIIKI